MVFLFCRKGAVMQKQVEWNEAIKRKYPEGVAIAIVRDKTGKPNPITLGWTMQVSMKPPMWAIALRPERYSTACIRRKKCFTYVLPTAQMADDALYFGTTSGRDVDKFGQRRTKLVKAKKIDSVLMADAVANFECVLEGEMTAGDHIIFVGRVVASWVNTKTCRRLYTVKAGRVFGSFTATKP
jgi:flavin reductase (DIM6/NTAB) family NADH-FMN oxidoreductase RutF